MTELSVYGVKVICDSKCKINDWHFQNAEERKVAEAINRLDLFLRCEMMTLKSIEVGEQRFHLPSEERKCPRCEYPYEPPKPPSSEDKKKECIHEDCAMCRIEGKPPAAPEKKCECHPQHPYNCKCTCHEPFTHLDSCSCEECVRPAVPLDAIKDNEKSLKPPQEAAKLSPPAQDANAVEEKIKEVARNWSVPPYEAIEKELFSLVDLARRTV